MTVTITIFDDAGKEVLRRLIDPFTPHVYKAAVPLTQPCVVDNQTVGQYSWFGFTYQPMVKLSGKRGGT